MTPRGSPRRLWAGSRPRGPRNTRAGPSRGLEGRQYACWWVDGIYTTLRESDDPKLCLLVIIGVRPDGTKEWVAISDGLRECTESWLDGLRDIKARGLQAGPRLAVGDGALGF